jgi:uncharacterized membrane protein
MTIFFLAAHLLSAVIWVGGMFFAYVCLRPSVPGIELAPERMKLWLRVFSKFFPWVWLSILMLLLSGYAMIFMTFGGFEHLGLYINIMQGLGLIMMIIFTILYKSEWAAFKTAVEGNDMAVAAEKLGVIRILVHINLMLGLITIVVGGTGRYW